MRGAKNKIASDLHSSKPEAILSLFLILFLVRLEIVLAHATERAYPVFRNILKSRSRRNARLRVAHFGVVHPLAHCANILLHRFNWFKFIFISILVQVYYFLGRKQQKRPFAFVFLTHALTVTSPASFPVHECPAFTHDAAPKRNPHEQPRNLRNKTHTNRR